MWIKSLYEQTTTKFHYHKLFDKKRNLGLAKNSWARHPKIKMVYQERLYSESVLIQTILHQKSIN